MKRLTKRTFFQKRENKTKFFFKCDDGFMIRNLRFRIHWAKWNPKGKRLHIQIWTPLFCFVRDNCKTELGNKYKIYHYHY